MLPVAVDGPVQGKGSWNLTSEDRGQWVKEQKEDATITRLLSGDLKMGRFRLLVESDGLVRLIRKGSQPGSSRRTVTIVPVSRRIPVMQHFHDHALGGHLGISRTLTKIKEYFWWPLLTTDVTNYILRCPVCRKSKIQRTVTRPLRMGRDLPPIPGYAIALDLVSFQSIPSKDGYKYVLTIIDQFTRFLRFLPLKAKAPEGVAQVLLKEWICLFGTPAIIHTDGGGEFEAHVVWKLCNLLGIKKEMSCPNAPYMNGRCERAHRYLKQYLRAYVLHHKDRTWPKLLAPCSYAHNCCPLMGSAVSPFECMMGRKPPCRLLDLDPAFRVPGRLQHAASSLAQTMARRVVRANEMWYDWAKEFRAGEQARQNRRDSGETGRTTPEETKQGGSPTHGLVQGDLVYVKRRPSNKLDTEYKGPYRVVSEDADVRWRVLELLNPASGRRHWENTSNLVRQPEQPVAPAKRPESKSLEERGDQTPFSLVGRLQKGQLVAFEAALPKGSCSPYGWNLAEVLEADTGDQMTRVWVWNNRYGSPTARMHRAWWRGTDKFHVEEEKYSAQNPGDPFRPFADRVHWSRIWEVNIALKGGRVPEDVRLRLEQRLTEFRRRARISRRKREAGLKKTTL